MPVDKILRKPDVEEITGLTERSIRDLEAAGDFPPRILINPKGRSVGWLASEVQIWLEQRSASRSVTDTRRTSSNKTAEA